MLKRILQYYLERQLMFANQLFGLIRHSIMKICSDFNYARGIVRQEWKPALCGAPKHISVKFYDTAKEHKSALFFSGLYANV
jgi:hypothetical protein